MGVVVVVGIGRQPAPHRSEVVKTPLLPSSGAVTPHMTGGTGQQPNLKIKSPTCCTRYSAQASPNILPPQQKLPHIKAWVH